MFGWSRNTVAAGDGGVDAEVSWSIEKELQLQLVEWCFLHPL